MRLKPVRLPLYFMAISSILALSACGRDEDSALLSASKRAVTCGQILSCDAAPTAGIKTGFLSSDPKGTPFHFGKDYYLNESEDQWVIAQFQYGNYFFRKPLVHEQVDIQLLRGCGEGWESLGTAMTSAKGENVNIQKVEDLGGMVFFKIPDAQRLGLGRHRIRLVVSGDQTATELFLEVLPQGARLFVSDVDGTLTTSEIIEGVASVFGTLPPAHPGAADLLTGLTKKGYHPLYLTARSTNLIQRTRDFVRSKKFPGGVVQTSSATTFGISGDKGIAYKTAVLQDYEDRGFSIDYAFGNTKVDATAFANVDILDSHKFFYKFPKYVDYGGGVNHDNYGTLDAVRAAPNLCL